MTLTRPLCIEVVVLAVNAIWCPMFPLIYFSVGGLTCLMLVGFLAGEGIVPFVDFLGGRFIPRALWIVLSLVQSHCASMGRTCNLERCAK